MHVEWVDDEAVVLDSETKALHYLNPPAALLYALIQELGYEGAVTELRRRYEGSEDLEEELAAALDEMIARKLLVAD
jgi:hypothetical protein